MSPEPFPSEPPQVVPHLSVIIPAFNESSGIADFLIALAPLRHQGAELIVIDGGSHDGTPALALPHADRVISAAPGRARQMNAGAEVARGGILLFLHADCRLPADAMESIHAVIARGAQWGRFDVHIEGRHPMLRVVAAMINLRSRLSGIATGDQGIFVLREAFIAVGSYPDIPLMEDIALSDRLRRKWRPACLRKQLITSGRRWDNNGIWQTIWLMWRLRAAYRLGVSPQKLARIYYPPAGVHLAVLARAPIAGSAKTRLIPALGAAGAARLHRHMVLQTLAKAHAAKIGPVTLWGTTDQPDRFFRALMRCGVRYEPQPAGDLGERMRSVMLATLPTPTILIGTDCPPLTPEHLRAAADALRAGQDAVFIPVEDGGYALIGLNKSTPNELFLKMPWGSDSVMAETRTRLKMLGYRWSELATLWDMDRPEDLQRLPPSCRKAGGG